MLQFSPFDFIAKIVTIKIHFRYSISLFRAISIFGENDIHVYTKTHFLMIFFYDIKILLMKYKKKKLGNISHGKPVRRNTPLIAYQSPNDTKLRKDSERTKQKLTNLAQIVKGMIYLFTPKHILRSILINFIYFQMEQDL